MPISKSKNNDPDHILKELGKAIKAIRRKKKLKQERCAVDSDIDYKRWQRLEAGAVNPTFKTLVRASAGLDTTFWQMMLQIAKMNLKSKR